MARARRRAAPAKLVKFLTAILLLPVCWGVTSATVLLVQTTASADTFWVPTLAGAGCWLAIYAFLPKPIWAYVCGHELTHVLWAWLFGGRVKKIKISSKGGYVILTKTNFLIALAPYFFPLYAALILTGFVLGHAVWDLRPYFPLLYLLLGAAYCFHITLTCHALKTQQTDLAEHGILFSAMIIWLGNLAVIILALPLLTSSSTIFWVLRESLHRTGDVLGWMIRIREF